MGAFATVQLPVDLTRCHDAAGVVSAIVTGFPGTRSVTLDAVASTVTFELHFPGNLSALIARLRENIIPVGAEATVTVPVESLVPALISDTNAVGTRVVEGAHVWDVAFARGPHVTAARMEGGSVIATIVPGSDAMHQIYDALLSLGIVVNDLELAAARGR